MEQWQWDTDFLWAKMTMFIQCLLQSYSITYIAHIYIYIWYIYIYEYIWLFMWWKITCNSVLLYQFGPKKSPRRHCERLFGKANHRFATASCDVNSYGRISHFKTTWLVVDLPLWKVWVRELGWWNSQLNGKIKKCSNPPNRIRKPVDQIQSIQSL